MESKKINQLATAMSPSATDLTIIGDPVSGVSKKATLQQISSLFGSAVSFYTNLAAFPATGTIDTLYCAKDTNKLYLWSGSAYVQTFPSQALLDTYQLKSEKGASNGYASLDSSGKVPISQLPSSIMEYKGMWNASTNTPTLANGTGDTGDVYICNVAGTVNFGAGAITFAVGDYVIYSGTIWQRSSGAVGTVTSVAVTETGDALTITGSPVTTAGTINIGFAGTSAQYVAGDGTLITFPSLTGYVPYTGATTDVDLGTHVLNAQALHVKGTAGAGHLGLKHQTATPTGSANESLIFADVNGNLGWQNDNLYLSTFVSNANTANRTYTLPNASGTIALTSDIPSLTGYVTLGTTQTITATKYFSAQQYFQTYPIITQSGIALDTRLSGTAASNHTTLCGNTNGLQINLQGGAYNNLNFADTANGYTYTFPAATGTIALTSDIPSLTGYVTLATTQTISGQKSFTSLLTAADFTNGFLTISGGTIDRTTTGTALELQFAGNGPIRFFGSTAWPILFSSTSGIATFSNSITASSFIKSGGTSSQYLMADGSVDSNTYLTTSSASSTYLPLSGGTLTGSLVGTSATFSGILTLSNGTTSTNQNATGFAFNRNISNGAIFSNTGFAYQWQRSMSTTATSDILELQLYNPSGAYVNSPITFNGTGAATFSSSVTATQLFASTSSNVVGGINSSDANGGYLTWSTSSTVIADIGTANQIFGSGGAEMFGINARGARNLAFGTNNTERMRITSGGNVGIGTSSPSNLLHVSATSGTLIKLQGSSTGNNTNSIQGVNGSGDIFELGIANAGYTNATYPAIQAKGAYLYGAITLGLIAENGPILFQTAAAERMRITSDGNVGIGTSSPATLLHLASSSNTFLTIDAASASNSGLAFYKSGAAAGAIYYLGASDAMRFDTANTERMRITSGGNVGIGTSSPSNRLTVAGSSGTIMSLSNGADADLLMNFTSGVTLLTPTTGILAFGTSSTERMRITSGGNVGIGTSSPDRALTVNGQIGLNSDFVSTKGGTTFRIGYDAYVTTSGVNMFTESTIPLVFGTNSSERMRITSVGNIRTYVTPSVDSKIEWYNTSSGTIAGEVWSDGNPRVNIRCNSAGGVYLSSGATSWTGASDETLKDINFIIDGAIDKINTLRAVNFSWKSDETKKENLGLIAQDVEKVFPQIVDEGEDGIKGVRYTELIPVLVKAIQEQQSQIEELKAEIDELKNK